MFAIITSALRSIIVLLAPSLAIAQECSAVVSAQCSEYMDKLVAGACPTPGSIFVLKDKWEPAARAKIAFAGQNRVQFFYVIDGRNVSAKYDVLFVSIDRIFQQTVYDNVKLTQNREFKFKASEDKQKYSRALQSSGQPTQPMRQWGNLPDFGNVFLQKDDAVIADFNIPEAIDAPQHAPHARLYRYETGNISCIPFSAGLNSDVDHIFGKAIDSSARTTRTVFFQIAIE